MKIEIRYINIKIPVPHIVLGSARKTRVKGLSRRGIQVWSVVTTQHGFDFGLVAKMSNGRPSKVYAMYDGYQPRDAECSEYGAADCVDWYNTGVTTTLQEWKRLARATGDARGFHQYWCARVLSSLL